MRLVVTTWNLQGSEGVDVPAVVSHLQAEAVDVVLLQEVQRRQARAIARALEARSCRWAFKHWPVRTRAEGMAILGVTVPVRDTTARALTERWRFWSWRRRIVQFGLVERWRVVNVHLSPHQGAELRRREVAAVLARLEWHPEAPATLLAGDFNSQPTGAIRAELVAAGWQDAWTATRRGEVDGALAGFTNWPPGPRSGPPDKRIDYVWVSSDAKVLSASLPIYGQPGFDRFPPLSDHLPLTVTLEL